MSILMSRTVCTTFKLGRENLVSFIGSSFVKTYRQKEFNSSTFAWLSVTFSFSIVYCCPQVYLHSEPWRQQCLYWPYDRSVNRELDQLLNHSLQFVSKIVLFFSLTLLICIWPKERFLWGWFFFNWFNWFTFYDQKIF